MDFLDRLEIEYFKETGKEAMFYSYDSGEYSHNFVEWLAKRIENLEKK